MLEMIGLFPHPPIVVPEVGGEDREQISSTAAAMEKLAVKISEINPEVVVAITPHGPIFKDAITITALDYLEGDLSQFGAPQVQVGYKLDRAGVDNLIDLVKGEPFLCAALDEEVLEEYGLEAKLDHGLVVPLSFLDKAGWQGQLIPVNIGLLSYEDLYSFGKVMTQALDNSAKSWVLLVSGDLSHCLTPGAPAGFSPQGAVFDEIIRQCIREGDVKRIFNLDPDLVEEAAECGLRPLVIAMGVLDGYEIKSEELSYEGTFGVGYLTAIMERGRKLPSRELRNTLYEDRKEKAAQGRDNESTPVKIARKSITYFLDRAREISIEDDEMQNILIGQGTQDLMRKKAGVFVSLKKYGQLRGCIGTIESTKTNLAQEIIANAVSAAIRDPRFEPLESVELEELNISVDVLDPPESITHIGALDPQVYGVIVTSGSKRGLLLPNLPGITSAEEQINIARDKAGIKDGEMVTLERFRVTRYT